MKFTFDPNRQPLAVDLAKLDQVPLIEFAELALPRISFEMRRELPPPPRISFEMRRELPPPPQGLVRIERSFPDGTTWWFWIAPRRRPFVPMRFRRR